MAVERRQRYVRVRVRSLTESSGEWGSPSKDWEDEADGTIRKLLALTTIEGNRELARKGAEYDADWFGYARARPEFSEGDLIETLDANDDAIDKFIIKKVLARGRYVGLLLHENPNIQ